MEEYLAVDFVWLTRQIRIIAQEYAEIDLNKYKKDNLYELILKFSKLSTKFRGKLKEGENVEMVRSMAGLAKEAHRLTFDQNISNYDLYLRDIFEKIMMTIEAELFGVE